MRNKVEQREHIFYSMWTRFVPTFNNLGFLTLEFSSNIRSNVYAMAWVRLNVS